MLPIARAATRDEIPVIDLQAFKFTDDRTHSAVAQELCTACKTVGFAYIVNHGIEGSAIDRIYEVARKFFALPEEAKNEVSLKKSGYAFNGFLPSGHVGQDSKLKSDLHESFQAHLDLPEDDPARLAGTPFYGPNLWPSSMPELKREVVSYQEKVRLLGERMLSLLAVGLDLPVDTFTKYTRKPVSMLRMLHYPPQPATESESLGTRAHNDTGLITILAQDEVGGLEVLLNSGEWVAASPMRHAYVINIGDMMSVLSDGIYASTPHRVINRSGRERYSVPFFVNPDFATPYAPLVSNPNEKIKKFESLVKNTDGRNYGEWLVDVYSRIYNMPEAARA
jgi:isopenicillin N synthase-like dioxygenase